MDTHRQVPAHCGVKVAHNPVHGGLRERGLGAPAVALVVIVAGDRPVAWDIALQDVPIAEAALGLRRDAGRKVRVNGAGGRVKLVEEDRCGQPEGGLGG